MTGSIHRLLYRIARPNLEGEKPEKPEKLEKPEKPEKPEKTEKPEKPEKSEARRRCAQMRHAKRHLQ